MLMVVKGLCLADKKMRHIKKNPQLKIQRTRTGIKARVVGYSKRCKDEDGEMVQMSSYVRNKPLSYVPEPCFGGKQRNPISGRCNIPENMGRYIVSYSGPQKRKMKRSSSRPMSSKSTRSSSKPKLPSVFDMF